MSKRWTDEQASAVSLDGSNLLVAAGAGSGKTTVLVARILRRILGDANTVPCNVDRLLIVTFTKAAAEEMRQRLYEALQKKLLDESTDEETLARVYLQQTLLSRATITTIHGFCNRVVNGNSQESGIDGSFRLGDEAETGLLLKEACEEVCELFCKENPDTYSALVDTYGSYRSDEGLLSIVREIVGFAMAFPDPKAWIEAQVSAFRSIAGKSPVPFAETVWGRTLLDYMILQMEALTAAIQRLYDIALFHQVTPYVDTLREDVASYTRALGMLRSPNLSWEDAREAICGIAMDNLNRLSPTFKKQLSEDALAAIDHFSKRRLKIKTMVETFRNQYFSENIPSPDVQGALLQQDIVCLGDMACALIDRFREKKRSYHLIDYGDLEHIALQVLSKPDVAQRYREQYEEIYIDEYQDTNLIQEQILRLVSREDGFGAPNLFMVGDIKQSVYGFRQACPDLFLDKYKTYTKMLQTDAPGRCICLYMNFRSRISVLETVNAIFSNVMHENTCGMDYTAQEYLNYGAKYYDEYPVQAPTEVVLVNVDGFEDPHLPEMYEVARRIETMVAEQYPVYDSKKGTMRPVTYGDICILLRNTASTGTQYRDFLQSRGIPAFCPEKGGFFQRPEVQVLLSFLKILDNPRQDIPLISVLRNIYGFTDESLAQMVLQVPGQALCFWDRLQQYAQAQGGATQLFLNRYQQLRQGVSSRGIGETVWICMHENGFFQRLTQLPGGQVARQNLLLLMNRAVRYDQDINHGLYNFVNRLDKLARDGGQIPGAGTTTEGFDAVRIMTIHGSKGLEFPVVFLCATHTKRNRVDENQRFLMHRNLGFGPACYDRQQRLRFPSAMFAAVRRGKELDSKAEELRVLYVALTRAREKLIITGSVRQSAQACIEAWKQKCDPDTGKPLDFYILQSDTYLDTIGLALCQGDVAGHYRITEGLYTQEKALLECGVLSEDTEVSFGLPTMPLYNGASGIDAIERPTLAPAKVSVSELKRLRASWEDAIPAMGYSTQQTVPQTTHFTAAQIGTLIHSVLQHIDYRRIDTVPAEMEAYAQEMLLQMEDEGFISAEERDVIPVSVITAYLTSDFAARVAKASWMRREIPFTFLESWKKLTGGDEPGETAVQGVIDMVCEVEGRLILVDFKSDAVDRDFATYSKRYAVQLDIYRQACIRAFGREPDEVYLYYLRAGHEERIGL